MFLRITKKGTVRGRSGKLKKKHFPEDPGGEGEEEEGREGREGEPPTPPRLIMLSSLCQTAELFEH